MHESKKFDESANIIRYYTIDATSVNFKYFFQYFISNHFMDVYDTFLDTHLYFFLSFSENSLFSTDIMGGSKCIHLDYESNLVG